MNDDITIRELMTLAAAESPEVAAAVAAKRARPLATAVETRHAPRPTPVVTPAPEAATPAAQPLSARERRYCRERGMTEQQFLAYQRAAG